MVHNGGVREKLVGWLRWQGGVQGNQPRNRGAEPVSECIPTEIRREAEQLYASGRALCSEALLVVFNRRFDGGLSDAQAMGLAAGLPVGLGESGCLCGALSGGILALGLLLGSGGVRSRKRARRLAKKLHNEFKRTFHSTCCRVLSREVKHNPKAHFRQCLYLTGAAAEMTARLVLQYRPALGVASPDAEMRRPLSSGGGAFARILRTIFSRRGGSGNRDRFFPIWRSRL